MRELDNNNHSVFAMYYHLVLVIKYRRNVIDDVISNRLREIFENIQPSYNIAAQEWNHDKDHVHMFLNCLPTQSPADIMQNIKGFTSKILREEFEQLSKMPSLWTRSYFVSTAGNVCSETIKKYVENQKSRY